MNWDRVEGNWKEFQGKVQQQWGKLTNDDLDVVKGKRTELSGRLQQRYGYGKDEADHRQSADDRPSRHSGLNKWGDRHGKGKAGQVDSYPFRPRR